MFAGNPWKLTRLHAYSSSSPGDLRKLTGRKPLCNSLLGKSTDSTTTPNFSMSLKVPKPSKTALQSLLQMWDVGTATDIHRGYFSSMTCLEVSAKDGTINGSLPMEFRTSFFAWCPRQIPAAVRAGQSWSELICLAGTWCDYVSLRAAHQ